MGQTCENWLFSEFTRGSKQECYSEVIEFPRWKAALLGSTLWNMVTVADITFLPDPTFMAFPEHSFVIEETREFSAITKIQSFFHKTK